MMIKVMISYASITNEMITMRSIISSQYFSILSSVDKSGWKLQKWKTVRTLWLLNKSVEQEFSLNSPLSEVKHCWK